MYEVLKRFKPTKGFAVLVHNSLRAILPLIIFVLVRLNENEFTQIAIILVLLSKWRMFAVRPRFWAANLRANAVDLMVGVSVILFMTHSSSFIEQFGWALAYGVWLIYLKPATSSMMMSIQAGIGQLCALSSLYVAWGDGPLVGLTLVTGIICYLAARHFYDAFDESYSRLLSYLWGYFGAALAWLLSHWLLFYGPVSQPVVFLTTLGYGVGVLYYWDHNKKPTKNLQRQIIAIMLIIVLIVIIFSDWSGKLV